MSERGNYIFKKSLKYTVCISVMTASFFISPFFPSLDKIKYTSSRRVENWKNIPHQIPERPREKFKILEENVERPEIIPIDKAIISDDSYYDSKKF